MLILLGLLLLAAAGTAPHFPNASAQAQKQQQSPAQPPVTTPTVQTPAMQPPPALRTIVLDPGHGGEDSGARGPSGLAERDIVLEFAQTIAGTLRAEGFEVVMTRTGDTDPSLDDRDAVANAQSNAILISLHVGSAGPIGTVQTYTYLFPITPPPAPSSNHGADASASEVPPLGFLLWSEAQKPFVAQSVKLGDLIQVELTQKFKGSSEISASAPVAVLRSAAVPAVAVEVSSVAADQQKLESMGADLASSIARAVQAYKTIYPRGGK